VELQIGVVAYCLMPNHYHFLLKQIGTTSAGRCIQLLFNSYTKAFNVMERRTGTLFESPFKAIEVDDPDYLRSLCRYIHRNPVKANLVHQPEEWEFSNYQEWIGLREDVLVDKDFIILNFQSIDAYKEYVARGTEDSRLCESLKLDHGM
jgi:REP element-mobilizing transposase RayT